MRVNFISPMKNMNPVAVIGISIILIIVALKIAKWFRSKNRGIFAHFNKQEITYYEALKATKAAQSFWSRISTSSFNLTEWFTRNETVFDSFPLARSTRSADLCALTHKPMYRQGYLGIAAERCEAVVLYEVVEEAGHNPFGSSHIPVSVDDIHLA